MKSVTGVRDGKHTHVSNLTISRDQLAYCGEREPREPKESRNLSSPGTKGDDRQLAIVSVCVSSAATYVTIKAYAVGRTWIIHQRV